MKTAMQQIVAKGRQPPSNINLFKPSLVNPNPVSRKRKLSPPQSFPGKRPCVLNVQKPLIGRNDKQPDDKKPKTRHFYFDLMLCFILVVYNM